MRKKAIILAAGKGDRLVRGFAFPKPLKRVAGVPLIIRILRGLEEAGVEEVGIVVGHLADVLIAGVQKHRLSIKVEYFWNDEVEKPNGTSLLKAKEFVDSPTLLTMSDHLWSPDLVETVGTFPLRSRECVLGIDYNIEHCFDLPDATKVRVSNGRIVNIGKTLDSYNALDTGMFCITPSLIAELEGLNGPRGCSLSQGVEALSRQGLMRAADVGRARWIDVDTPEAHAYAEETLASFGDNLRPTLPPMEKLA